MRVQTDRRLWCAVWALAFVATASRIEAQDASATRTTGATRQLQAADLKGWKTIRQSVLSNDGKWFAYVLAPNEGDASVVIRSTSTDGKEMKFPIGDVTGGGRGGAPAAGRGGDAGASPSLAISGDSRWVAFTIYPSSASGRSARGRGGPGRSGSPQESSAAPVQNKLGLVNLATGEKKEFDAVRRFAFNGDKPTWLAMHGYPPPAAQGAAGATTAPTGRGGNGAALAGRSTGTDLVLYNLASGDAVNVGNVAEFGFDDSGEWLAYTIDARDEIGNGVQLRNMRTDVVRPIDSDRAVYRQLVWADSLAALAVLRGRIDSTAHDTLYSVLSFTNLAAPTLKKVVFDAAEHRDFPAGMKVAVERAPHLADDLSAVFFGIREAKSADAIVATRGSSIIQAGAPGMGGTINQPRVNEAQEENPSLILWHGKDPRLQSQQIVQEAQDRAYSYLSEYRFGDGKFVRLADDALRTVNLTGHDHYAYGIDTREYDLEQSYDGRAFQDVYGVDLGSGQRKLLLKKHVASTLMPSPNGRRILFWDDDAQWSVLDVATGDKRVISRGVPAVFADTSDDHNNIVTPPDPPVAWSKDGNSVLVSDAFDVWKLPVNGNGVATNLTVDGKQSQIRYQRLYPFGGAGRQSPNGGGRGGRGGRGGAGFTDGVDLSQPLYFSMYGEWTKKEGLARVDAAKPGAQRLVWDDAKYSFEKAKDADVFAFTRQTAIEFPNYYVAGADLTKPATSAAAMKAARQLTDANPQQKEFAWTSGVRLIDYTSDKGDKLQGALYLPANYEPGKKYPLLVTIYEKRSNLAHSYVTPNETSTPNRSIYTSRGYAVLDPDIVYRVNDPGMSAVWCVIPAVKAAIATGMIDSTNVGLWGHSWGGYQTAFLVTQTHIFKAAIAGAPLTDMVSMYGSIYWNTGGADQAIFESSQGRFKGNYIDNYDAYIRNSPNFHAKNVTTPLIILSDDKDGAVDFNQGITYFNTLRQLGKDVILLEYVGENHGLARPINQKDYAMRQKDWFDHYLKGTPAPDWMTKGIPRIKMDEYWRSLKANQTVVP
jgi:dipeptidyl aminopeptidase/acylaminoacyl peptidase